MHIESSIRTEQVEKGTRRLMRACAGRAKRDGSTWSQGFRTFILSKWAFGAQPSPESKWRTGK